MFLDGPSFAEYWRRFRGRTMRILDLLPADDLEWTHAPGKYTFGDIFRHLPGIERYMYGETVRSYAERCHAESLEILGDLTLEDLTSKCLTPSGTPITVWKWLRAMVEHEAHHRGQLYLMAGIRGISVPPLYGLTEEEVVSLSERPVGELR